MRGKGKIQRKMNLTSIKIDKNNLERSIKFHCHNLPSIVYLMNILDSLKSQISKRQGNVDMAFEETQSRMKPESAFRNHNIDEILINYEALCCISNILAEARA